jgi:hypothetical protein
MDQTREVSMFTAKYFLPRIGCLAAVFVLGAVFPVAAEPPHSSSMPRLIQGPVSRPLRSIPPLAPTAGSETRPLRIVSPPDNGQSQPDTALQTTVLPSTPNVAFGFPGVGNGDYGYTVGAAPPDTNGAVGSTQYIQWVNTSFAIFDKAGNLQYGPAAGNTLFSDLVNDPNLGACATTNDGDPVVQYDQLAHRWLMSQVSFSSGNGYFVCIAVSESDQASGALGTWNRYAVTWSSTLPDYPKMSIWPNAYFLTANLFLNVGIGYVFVGSQACALDSSVLQTNGNPTPNTLQCTQAMSGAPSLTAASLDGSQKPLDPSTGFLMNLGSNALNLWKFKVDFTNSSNTALTGPISIPVAAFTRACSNGGTCIPQKNTSQKLDSLGDRLMFRLAYRNFGSYESMVVNHSVSLGSRASSHTGVRWYEIRNPSGTPTVFQQGTFSPDANHRWMGSIAMDKKGNIALGYSVSGPTLYPGIRYAGRQSTDPRGTLEAEVHIYDGLGSQLPNLSRWGDYSRMSIDPVDDCTFWYTNEYLKASGTFNWSTWIVNFKFPGCS